jgi:hypothetical protein
MASLWTCMLNRGLLLKSSFFAEPAPIIIYKD